MAGVRLSTFRENVLFLGKTTALLICRCGQTLLVKHLCAALLQNRQIGKDCHNLWTWKHCVVGFFYVSFHFCCVVGLCGSATWSLEYGVSTLWRSLQACKSMWMALSCRRISQAILSKKVMFARAAEANRNTSPQEAVSHRSTQTQSVSFIMPTQYESKLFRTLHTASWSLTSSHSISKSETDWWELWRCPACSLESWRDVA